MAKQELIVVGIGASAGGLEALEELFDAVPVDTNMAFVIVQHLSPNYKSLMDELLRKHTQMSVDSVNKTTELRRNHVYLNPKEHNIICKGNKLLLSKRSDKSTLNLPVDEFFHSLGREYGENSVGIILSGTGTDGSRGIKTIKEKGGTIIVQNPETAKFDGMPNASIFTRLPDFILSPQQAAKELVSISRGHSTLITTNTGAIRKTFESCYNNILDLVLKHTGINFHEYKHNTIVRRMERRMEVNHITDITKYNDYLTVNDAEVDILQKEFLIGVTSFFRDRGAYESLKEKVIPKLFKGTKKEIRIWTAGCSTGEEAYSMAILLNELSKEYKTKISFKIFATDVDVDALTVAANGIYPINILSELDDTVMDEYFQKKGNECSVNKVIREKIIFSKHNLIDDPPFINMDLIICRNLLIYMNNKSQKNILETFLFALNENSYLFLGKSESLGLVKTKFEVIDQKNNIFQNKVRNKFLSPELLKNSKLQQTHMPAFKRSFSRNPTTRPLQEKSALDTLKTILLKSYLPSCIVLDSEYNTIYFHGITQNYLDISEIAFKKNIFDLINSKSLSLLIRSGLRKLKSEEKSLVSLKNVSLESNKKNAQNIMLDIIFKTITATDEIENIFYLVEFEEKISEDKKVIEFDLKNINSFAKQCIRNLELELDESQTELKRAVGSLETSNEELQASNEELLSSNEELQSTNEELQSVNEELFTVNSEVQSKNIELSDLNDDIQNLLENTDIATLYITGQLRVRKFTPAIKKYFTMNDNDIGRHLEDFTFKLKDKQREAFYKDIKTVCTGTHPIQKEYETSDNITFLTKIHPFTTINKKRDGVVLSFYDITNLLNTEKELKIAKEKAEEADKLKSIFLANMSHEIRTPMNAIIGFGDLLQGDDVSKEENLEYTNIIKNQGNYLLSLIDDIIDFAKIESNTIKINMIEVSLFEILNEIYNFFTIHETDNVKLLLSIPHKLRNFTIITDPFRLKQVLNNLINNAFKFTESGTIKFGCKQVGTEKIEFYVSDTGIGMSSLETKHIFDRFYQVIQSEKGNRAKGTGLGLSISKAIVQLLGGNLSVKSKVKKGSAFSFKLPFEYTQTVSMGEILTNEIHQYTKDELIGRYKGTTILIAEDTESNFLVLKYFLLPTGAKLIKAVNGLEAVDIVKKNDITVVLLDIFMPVMDGYKAAKLIREINRDVPIIAQTAYVTDKDIKKITMDDNFTDYLLKPINNHKLFNMLDTYINKKKITSNL